LTHYSQDKMKTPNWKSSILFRLDRKACIKIHNLWQEPTADHCLYQRL